MSKKFKRSLSIVLAILMIAAMSCIAATSAGALTAGTQIFFDNSQTQWENVYIYGWNYGLSGDFVELEPIAEDSDIYAYTLTYDTVDGSTFCLFTNTTNWSGRQTVDIATEAGKNLWTPVVSEAGSIEGSWSYMTPPAAQPSVTATPGKNFAIEMSVTVNEFNCPGGARYTVNGGDSILFDGSATFIVGGAAAAIGKQYTVVVTGLDEDGVPIPGVTSTTTYTKVGMTTINANIDATSYDGPVYAYLFGGDRIGAAFYEMEETTAAGASERTFTLQFEGAGQVIFTTTDDWASPDMKKLNGSAEPLVEAGATASFDLVYPV